MGERSALAELSARFEQATAELTIPEVTGPATSRRLADIAAQAGLAAFFGTIAFVGENSSGAFEVQFNDTASNTGYSSFWPQWAFELAKAALLGGKNVLVLANGDPFGSNLVSVLVFA
ncbi:MAG TPA: hypothetical protein VFD04_15670 [Actinomycetes bacterium]|jgi:hypothetical protein|nr:hypothetical protein [Actinomycetes bacterium]